MMNMFLLLLVSVWVVRTSGLPDPRYLGCYPFDTLKSTYKKAVESVEECIHVCINSIFKSQQWNGGTAMLGNTDTQGSKCYCSDHKIKDNYKDTTKENNNDGNDCTIPCPGDSKNSCGGDNNMFSMYSIECLPGWWGENCSQLCGHCKTGRERCGMRHGFCPKIGCRPGWWHITCSRACPAGYFGDGCKQPCHCRGGESCDHITGECPGAICAAGWSGWNCSKGCSPGSYGENCLSLCHCMSPSLCNPVTGQCANSLCESGWKGKSCSEECESGTWGPGCTAQCQSCPGSVPCHAFNGTCPSSCDAGLQESDGCSQEVIVSESSNQSIVIVLVTLIILLALLIVLFYILYRKKIKGIFATGDEIDKHDFLFIAAKASCGEKSGRITPESSFCEPVIGALPRCRPIPVKDLMEIVLQERQSDHPYFDEYHSLNNVGLNTTDVASRHELRPKNRFRDTLAYDHTRVVLNVIDGDPDSDYINASYIQGYNKKDEFICAQGPNTNSIDDFWRMIWEKDVTVIVMLTNPVEAGRVKCEQYWHDEEKRIYGLFTVELEKSTILPDFTIRNFKLTQEEDGMCRIVRQYHFTQWPDHGVPRCATGIINLRKKILSDIENITNIGPIVVHCSAGVGRSGTFIALDYLLKQADAEGIVDILKCVGQLREQRTKMVQTREQYVFVHMALLEALAVGPTLIPCSHFKETYSNLFKEEKASDSPKLLQQYQFLESTRCIEDFGSYSAAISIINKDKNRCQKIIPTNIARPILMTEVDDRSDYINAVFVDGHREKNKYLATQMTLPGTVVDMWRMVYDFNCSCIVSLNNGQSDDEKLGQYWPDTEREVIYGPLQISLENETRDYDIIIRDIRVAHQKAHRTLLVRQFCVCKMDSDNKATQTPTYIMLKLHDQVQHWQMTKVSHGPVVVHCMNGVDETGVYLAVSNLCDMINIQQEVDVFQVVQGIRQNRPQFITSLEQYKFLYQAVRSYLESFSTYSNFQ